MKTRPLFDESAIAKRIKELGEQITRDYAGESLLVVSVLKGAFIFTADLVRQIKAPVEIDFIGLASYEGTQSTGHVRITSDLSAKIEGRNVLLVEDIVDTGKTLDFLRDMFSLRNPKSLRVCSLLSKPEAHQMRTPVDYVGFEITREFVIGYGLDLDQRYRELPYIAQVL
ncbi:hypoxanthine phosphoribosyltransferase [bacterium]|nr:hypoxanthine phosphoribosyltransferase [bacterium]